MTTEPDQSLVQLRNQSARPGSEKLARDIAVRYVADLREAGNGIVRSAEAAERQFRRCERIVDDVLATVRGDLTHPDGDLGPPVPADEALIDAGQNASDLAEASERLFAVALRGLLDVDRDEVFAIACALKNRLAEEDRRLHASSLDRTLREAPLEVIDRARVAELLTPRETQVLEILLEDGSIKAISSRLEISPNTAKHHITNIGRKLGARGRGEIVQSARDLGILVFVPVATHPPRLVG